MLSTSVRGVVYWSMDALLLILSLTGPLPVSRMLPVVIVLTPLVNIRVLRLVSIGEEVVSVVVLPLLLQLVLLSTVFVLSVLALQLCPPAGGRPTVRGRSSCGGFGLHSCLTKSPVQLEPKPNNIGLGLGLPAAGCGADVALLVVVPPAVCGADVALLVVPVPPVGDGGCCVGGALAADVLGGLILAQEV